VSLLTDYRKYLLSEWTKYKLLIAIESLYIIPYFNCIFALQNGIKAHLNKITQERLQKTRDKTHMVYCTAK